MEVECFAENDFIPELCTSYLARNFSRQNDQRESVTPRRSENKEIVNIFKMWALFCNSFPHVPYSLLVSCVKHPHLTVFSDRHFADAFIVWLTANEIESLSRTRDDDCTNILKGIHISLLPLWFAEGKIRCCYFSKFAEESINVILNLMAHQSARMMDFLGEDDSHQFKIRLTCYTKVTSGKQNGQHQP